MCVGLKEIDAFLEEFQGKRINIDKEDLTEYVKQFKKFGKLVDNLNFDRGIIVLGSEKVFIIFIEPENCSKYVLSLPRMTHNRIMDELWREIWREI